ncbi:MAG: hypothetical protein U5R06_00415 [candidate division KSB1 bacterium]|nr:hypothetical protein [candidate division KSB1 bacterium]
MAIHNEIPQYLNQLKVELKATKRVRLKEIVDYETRLEPNPEMHVSEGTFYPTTRDRQQIIIKEPVYAEVEKTVPDEERRTKAAEKLSRLVLEDEQWIDFADRHMTDDAVFTPYWKHIYRNTNDRKTRKTAARKLGYDPLSIVLKAIYLLGILLIGLAVLAFSAAWIWVLVWVFRVVFL